MCSCCFTFAQSVITIGPVIKVTIYFKGKSRTPLPSPPPPSPFHSSIPLPSPFLSFPSLPSPPSP